MLDEWIQQGPNHLHGHRHLSQGPHEIVLEYFEAAGDAVAKLDYEQTSDPHHRRRIRSRPSTSTQQRPFRRSGPHPRRRCDRLRLGSGRTRSAVPSDRFSARWTRTKDYEAGTYRFSVTGDDGIQVLVDGEQVVDGGSINRRPPTAPMSPLSQGQHTVVVEYFEHTGGAVAGFSESKVAGG